MLPVMNQGPDGSRQDGGQNRHPFAFVWAFLLLFGTALLCLIVSVASYRLCNWLDAWGTRPWYSVPEWVHDFGWVVGAAAGLIWLASGIGFLVALIVALFTLGSGFLRLILPKK